jgi:HEAT repeat protein
MLIALIEQARAAEGRSEVASDVVDRIDEPIMAAFVARTVERQHGATERLAQALQLLVPDLDGRERVLELAKQEAQAGALGQEPGFADLWETAAQMLASYSDETYVSQEYARELSDAPAQALEVERVSDDPPERVKAWLGTVADADLRLLDMTLLLDLLRIETEASAWLEIAHVVGTEIEKRVQRGETQAAQTLAYTLAQETGPEGRAELREAAEAAMARLADGPLARRIAAVLRSAPDAEVEAYGRLCRTVGNRIITPLAEALMAEDNSRAIRRLREVLVGFGEAGRETVERLKRSQNPTARRTAIDMLRLFGGEALSDLTMMLDDGDPHVQRDAIRAIAQIGTDDAFAVLQQALMSGKGSSATIPQQIISLREARAVPLLCYVLKHSKPRGPFVGLHTQIMEALGTLGQHPASIDTLKAALYRGEWWAPGRTALLRRAAALALWRIGSPEALRVLESAAQDGGRRIRTAARIPAGTPSRRDREAS